MIERQIVRAAGMIEWARALAAGAIGGAIGYWGFFWIAGQGFYALILPGGLLGIGAGLFRSRSLLLATICGIAATLLGVFTEWKFAPFIADKSFGYFLTHVNELRGITLILIALGGIIGFYGPFAQWQRWRNPRD
jgi:hypothetical protein